MLAYLLKKSDFLALGKLLSTGLLKVIPPGPALKLLSKLTQNKLRPDLWLKVVAELTQSLQGAHKEVVLFADQRPAESLQLDAKLSHEDCQKILEIYFFQIQNGSHWILDFRSSTFFKDHNEPQKLAWSPQAAFYEVDPNFAAGIAELYEGHYLQDNEKFTQGLQRLGIEKARHVISAHFGSGDLSSYQFSLSTFQSTFSELIHFCHANEIKLDVEFLVLGMMLLSLYENLETYGKPLDVQGAYRRAIK